jgi:DNA repair photolyase
LKLNFKTIYVENNNYSQSEQNRLDSILSKFPDAQIKKVASHWKIPDLADMDPVRWITAKKEILVLGKLKILENQVNGRSSDFIAPSHSNGCLSACQYCYVARRKGGSNPLTVFLNSEKVAQSIVDHCNELGPKTEPNQCDPEYWIYDIGNNNDVSIDAMISDNPFVLMEAIKSTDHGKLTFATKTVNIDPFLNFDPKGRTRIRYSLMPQAVSKYVDIRTSPILDRIDAMNELVEAGYEVHANFSPVIMYGDKQWKKDWVELWQLMESRLTEKAKQQMKSEVIFLTHSSDLHDINMQWNPKGEEFLWTPEIQQTKANKADVLCYKYGFKGENVRAFCSGIKKFIPWCEVRYAF